MSGPASTRSMSASAQARGQHEEAQADAARLLTMPSALAELTLPEAQAVIGYTRHCRFEAGTTVIAQGEHEATDFMFLVLSGDVTIENIVVSRSDPIVVSVLGPGNLIGEMGLLDGAPRSASCVASTDVTAAVLTRDALSGLIRDDPAIGAKLLIAVSQRLAARLREGGQKLLAYTQLARTMQDEIDSLDRVIAAAHATSTAATNAAAASSRLERREEALALPARPVA
jgi:CRP/FNR family transcriptional regulator, cyclic AMP receptor protein